MKILEIISATNGNLKIQNSKHEIKNILIDSRKSKQDCLYVSIVGQNLDGHNFIENAYQNGCRNFLVNENALINLNFGDINLIEVENTEKALGQIAKSYKEKFDISFIAVTGSVGKTTTRDMVHSVINEKYKTLKNEGNLNNHFGVPLTLFNLNNTYQSAVIEMGMSGFNEIEYLVNIVNPDIAIISNIGSSHIENLGSREGIFKAKMEITANFKENNTLIVNGDDEFLSTLKEKTLKYDLKTFGFGENNDIRCIEYEVLENKTKFSCLINEKIESFEIPTPGKHNIYNAMSAILAGILLDVSIENIKNGLLNFKLTKMRLDIIKNEKLTIINDCYNASVESMISSLEILKNYKERKVAILGDMFEMGDFSEEGHRKVGKNIKQNSDLLITVGKFSKYISEEAKNSGMNEVYHFENKIDLIKDIDKIIKEKDVILVKASRGMKLEEIVNHLNK